MPDDAARAAHAKRLLEDPLLTEVLDAIEAAAITAWRNTNSAQAEERTVAWYSLKAAERLRNTLKGIVDNGLVAASRATRQR